MSYLVAAYIICFVLLAVYLFVLGGRVAALREDDHNAQGVDRDGV